MDQGWVPNPNVAPCSYPTKLWGLFGMVAPTMPTTQQNFVIGPFAKMETSHWLRHIL